MTKDERIQELEDQIMVLKDALGMTYKGDVRWGLTATQTQILGLIAKTAVATNERIKTAMWGYRLDPLEDEDANMKVQISKMRPKLARYGIVIQTKWGVGYYLTPESRAIVNAV